jgi:hypothetical protein
MQKDTHIATLSLYCVVVVHHGRASGRAKPKAPKGEGQSAAQAQWAHDRGSSYRTETIYVQIHKARG